MDNLKLRMFGTVFLLQVIAMLLISVVVCNLQSYHLLEKRSIDISNIFKEFSLLSEGMDKGRLDSLRKFEILRYVKTVLGPECDSVFYCEGEKCVYEGAARSSATNSLVKTIQEREWREGFIIEEVPHKNKTPFRFEKKYLFADTSLGENGGKVVLGLYLLVTTPSILGEGYFPAIILYVIINATIFSTIFFFRIRSSLFDPVDSLTKVADSYNIEEGYGLFFSESRNEFGGLGLAMKAMVARIREDREHLKLTVESLAKANKQLTEARVGVVRAEKLAAIGRLSAGLAHEIGNPLTIIKGYLEIITQSGNLDEEGRLFLKRCLDELFRLDSLVRQMLDISRVGSKKQIVVDVVEVLNDLLFVLNETLLAKGVELDVHYSKNDTFTIEADGELLRQVLLNLVINAIDAIEESTSKEKGILRVRVFRGAEMNCDDTVVLELEDNGSGIQKEDMDLLFEPFFTTKEPGKGTGLGLSVTYNIVQSFGGTIDVTSEPGDGSVFKIVLPAYCPDRGLNDDI